MQICSASVSDLNVIWQGISSSCLRWHDSPSLSSGSGTWPASVVMNCGKLAGTALLEHFTV